ncbi:MAG: LEA type 2 family protein [bacterium]
MKTGHLFLRLLFVAMVCVLGCASVGELIKTATPKVSFSRVRLDKLSFDSATLLFDVNVENPNPVGVTLAGFDYDFILNERSFVQGNQEQGLEIPANGANIVQIPVTLAFADIYQTFKSLKGQDSTAYKLECGLAFELPFLGTKRIPISKQGTFPLLKLPKLSVESLKLEGLRLTGADLKLNLKLKNPNAFSFALTSLNYALDINNREWVTGKSAEGMAIAAKNESVISLPVSLNFVQIGQSAYQLLRSDQPLSYRFKGKFDMNSAVPLLGQVSLPFDRSGQIRLSK